jgi:hypothetical protein
VAQTTAPNGATLAGTGFPTMGSPTAIVLRGDVHPWPELFGDGRLCVGPGVVRLAASTASDGTSTHTFGHGAFAGSYAYQVWYRSTPSSFCDPAASFNLSNGVGLTWP